MQAIIAWFLKLFGGTVIQKILKCIPTIVAEVEKAMQDGKITADERKDIAMAAVDAIATEFGIKINGIIRWVISWLIDQIAKKLPSKDIVVTKVIHNIVSSPA